MNNLIASINKMVNIEKNNELITQLMNKNQELNSIIYNLKHENKEYRSKIKTCRICFERPENLDVIYPCGHYGFCSKCVTRIIICPICSNNIRDIKILYFS